MIVVRIAASAATFALLTVGALVETNCLSYAYRGLTDEKQLPTKEVVGMTYAQVVARFGAPTRVLSVAPKNQPNASSVLPTAAPDNGDTAPEGGKATPRKQVLLVYSHSRSYVVLLYQRVRSYTYTMTMESGRVTAFSAVRSAQADGISINSLLGSPVGAASGSGGPGASGSAGGRQ